ncbi:MAG TPA: response regulator transcription factor [Limnochordia bacterium]|nr:response regulator transcription factor [Limnochordia bacterium]
MAIRVLVVDDHEVVRSGLKALLGTDPGIDVVGEAGSAREALLATERLHPDLVIMDVRMPGVTGIEACREIRSRHAGVKVLMLTSYQDDDAVVASVLAGANGYVLKQIGGGELRAGIRKVMAGESLLDSAVADVVLKRLRDPKAKRSDDELTVQERKIVALIAHGQTNREIGKELFLSEKTVRNYVSAILAKMGVSNRAEAAATAMHEGWAELYYNDEESGDTQ